VRSALRTLVVVALAAGSLAVLPRTEAAPPSLPGCDPIDPKHCLLPFPNDFFTVADASTDTGRRVNLPLHGMPTNIAGKPIDPTEWNRNDGFSPGSMVLTYVPGVDLHATWDSPLDHIQDLSWHARPDAPIVLLNTRTGERHPFWSELDTHPETTDDRRLLIVRPAVNLDEGTRYVVALRNLRRRDGSVIPARENFAAYRDGDAHDARFDRAFGDLEAAGIGRGDLYLAWEFTVASERNLSERVLSIRDHAFAELGDTNLADGMISGRPPAFEVTEVTELEDSASLRRVEGFVTVPNYLTPQVHGELSAPPEADPVVDPVADLLPDPADDLVGDELRYSVPGSRLLGFQNPVQPTVDVPFTCEVPVTATVEPAHPILYGHGLLGDRTEVQGGSTEDLRRRNFAPCAMDWWGMSFADLANVATILVDASLFQSLADRSQQGFVNILYLGRALAHPEGFASHPAFAGLIRTGTLGYDGNSQGGIMGGALTALAPDFTRAVLGVPGMNYSTLLNRSIDWEGLYAKVAYANYRDKLEQQLLFGLIQMLWDRAEGNGYAHHMSSDPLPNTPPHQVMLQVAFADHQVANVAAEVEARTIGAHLHWPALPEGLHWAVDPTFGFDPWEPTAEGSLVGESVLVYWYSADAGNTTPPNGNVPPTAGEDPHEHPRRDEAGSDQKAVFLLTGEVIDACGGPCITTAETRG
jgi:hypothetical protein